MTRTFGPDNAIAWVQVRLRGGPRNLLSTTFAYAAVIGTAMFGSLQLIPEPPTNIMLGWTTGIIVIQAAVLLLFGSSRIIAAIRADVTSGAIESNRLMPVLPSQAIVGYILGASVQASCMAVVNILLGSVAAASAGIPIQHWLGANLVLIGFAAFVWVCGSYAAFLTKNPMGLVVLIPIGLSIGQGGIVSVLPGLTLLATPALGGSAFDMTATAAGFPPSIAVAIAGHVVVGAICFAAATRKYRRFDVIGFTPLRGLLLLAAWVALSSVGVAWWDELRPRYMRDRWVTVELQMMASLVAAMLLGLVPVFGAAEQHLEHVHRKLVGDTVRRNRTMPATLVIPIAALLMLPLMPGMRGLITNESLAPTYTLIAAAVVLMHLATASFLRRTMRFYTAAGVGIFIILLVVLWLGPFLADLVRHHLTADPEAELKLSALSCISPIGTLFALTPQRVGEVPIGLIVQALLLLGAGVAYRHFHPLRRAAAAAEKRALSVQ